MLTEPLMAGAHKNYNSAMIPNPSTDDDEKASLKAQSDDNKSPKYSADPSHASTSVPSLTRRMSSQFVMQVERQRSVVDNIGLTERINQVVPDAITNHIPGLMRRQSSLRLTYFCNICFTKNDIEHGFTLRRCQHQFCPECMEGYMNSKINNGVVNLTCFYPSQDSKACGEKIAAEDIHQTVSSEIWDKYERFKANSSNTYSRQCPHCNHTQNGDPDAPIMQCANEDCGSRYCLYHSNAHDVETSCEAYELSIAKETLMNEMAMNELGDIKPCPDCNFRIHKTGGCNHMKCVKCNCSFCWLCLEIIQDAELPNHYKDDASSCKGKQFEGMESEPPPRWIMALLVICVVVFCIPSTVLGIAFGMICFPFVLCCDCTNESGERQSLWDTMFGCWLIWLLLFILIAVFIPLLIFYCIWEVIKAIYGVIRLCLPCLPRCTTADDDGNNNAMQQQQVAGGQAQNEENQNVGNQGLLSNNDENMVQVNDVVLKEEQV